MSKLSWTQITPHFETGVDRGILFVNQSAGVAWLGLVDVENGFEGGELESYVYEGYTYLNVVMNKDFTATVTAITAPKEFLSCLGDIEAAPGLFLTGQQPLPFDFTYRTTIGDDEGFKIHLVYNAMVVPNDREYKTLSDSVSVDPVSWTIKTVPMEIEGQRPSAHFAIDSTETNPAIFAEIEATLRGTDGRRSHLPALSYILGLLSAWNPKGLSRSSVNGRLPVTAGGSDISPTPIAGVFAPLADGRLHETSTPGIFSYQE